MSTTFIIISKKVFYCIQGFYYACYKTFRFSEAPRLSARGEHLETELSDKIISKGDMGCYFNSVKEKYNMINPNDIEAYT